MTTEVRPAHSPLGASGAERWLNCPGSIALLQLIDAKDDSDDPDYRILGTQAHELAAKCLLDGTDTWEHADELRTILAKPDDVADGVQATCEAVQLYLDTVRGIIRDEKEEGEEHWAAGGGGDPSWLTPQVFVEYPISSPVHKDFYGTLDNGIIAGDTAYINDYKHGAGIAVDVEGNPQVRYYGWGLVQDRPEVRRVVYRIIQPRGYHPDGRVREWEESADDLRAWVRDELVPAMLATEVDRGLDAGPWCRFCPAKLVCPLLTGLFKAAALANPQDVRTLSDDTLGREYRYLQAVDFYKKALQDEAMARLSAGKDVAGIKLVHKKADRVWKPGAEVLLKEHFADEIYTEPKLKSPAQIEAIGAKAKALVHEYAYTPESGLTVALDSDKRVGVKVKTLAETFKAAIEAETQTV